MPYGLYTASIPPAGGGPPPRVSPPAGGPPPPLVRVTKTAATSTDSKTYTTSAAAKPSPSAGLRRNRNLYRLLRTAQEFAGDRRTSWCSRRLKGHCTHVSLWTAAPNERERSFLRGVRRCGSTWECPVCADKISKARRDELQGMQAKAHALGYHLLLVTWTARHHAGQSLTEVLDGLMKARRGLSAARRYKDLRARAGILGQVRSLEVTHGVNGWHPHTHELWFIERPLTHDTRIELQAALNGLWRRYCKKNGVLEPTESHGVTVQEGNHAARYIAKWGLDSEMTRALVKKGKRGHLTPWQILARAKDSHAYRNLWIEYAHAFTGRRQIVRSRGLNALLALAPEQTDIDIADALPEGEKLVAMIDYDTYLKIYAAGLVPLVLALALGDQTTLNNFLDRWRYLAHGPEGPPKISPYTTP